MREFSWYLPFGVFPLVPSPLGEMSSVLSASVAYVLPNYWSPFTPTHSSFIFTYLYVLR